MIDIVIAGIIVMVAIILLIVFWWLWKQEDKEYGEKRKLLLENVASLPDSSLVG